MKNIKAIWIIDKDYIVPAYLSISSFLEAMEVPVVVVYCGDNEIDLTTKLFTSLHDLISVELFATPEEYNNHPQKEVITNRLARMHYAEKSSEEVILLLDADTLFNENSDLLIKTIEKKLTQGESLVFGVLDAKMAYRDYLYFKTQDKSGRDIIVPHLEQKDIYTSVFGPNWWHHLKGPSINNGVIAFYNCEEVVVKWRDFYLSGLNHSKVNIGDDQLPLAAAIYKTFQKVVTLSERFNSKGNVTGDFLIYHAFSSIWKMQIVSAYKKEYGVSDFSKLAKRFLPAIPQQLLADFITKQNNTQAYLFRQLDGKFGFQHLYEDILSGLDEGIVVEVGMKNGKSTCFMMEHINNHQKDIRFYAIKSNDENNSNLDSFYKIVDQYELNNYADILEPSSVLDQTELKEKVDFVFLNLGLSYDTIVDNLNYWYGKLKPGGVLAGYDLTSQLGLHFGDTCATHDFCVKKNISVRISFNIFIIEKPQVYNSQANSDSESLVFNDSSVRI